VDDRGSEDEDLPSAGPLESLPPTREAIRTTDCTTVPRNICCGASASALPILFNRKYAWKVGQEGIGQYEHEAAGESPAEIGALPRVEIEGAGELPQRPGRLAALASRRSLRVAAKSRMKNPPITHGP